MPLPLCRAAVRTAWARFAGLELEGRVDHPPVAMPAGDARRSFNDDRCRLFAGTHREIVFVCECPDPECRYSVVLTPEAYERARREPPHVLLCEQHATSAAG